MFKNLQAVQAAAAVSIRAVFRRKHELPQKDAEVELEEIREAALEYQFNENGVIILGNEEEDAAVSQKIYRSSGTRMDQHKSCQ